MTGKLTMTRTGVGVIVLRDDALPEEVADAVAKAIDIATVEFPAEYPLAGSYRVDLVNGRKYVTWHES